MSYYVSFAGKQIATDKQGYLLDFNDWDQDLVATLAKQEEIELTQEHLDVVYFVRQFYLTYDTSPAMRALIKAMKPEFGEDKANSRYLQRLFPKGPAKQATKLAGLPKPAKCL